MRATIQDAQFRAIKEPNDRKAAYEKYLEQVVKEDEEREKERIRKLRTDFRTMLVSHPEIKHFTRWKTARPILEGEAIYRSTDDEGEKRRLFDDYLLDLKKAAEEKRQQDYDAAMAGVSDILKELSLTAKSQWLDTREQLHAHPEFQSDPKYSQLPPSESLYIFDKYMRRLWNDAHHEKQRTAVLKAREQRKARDDFVGVLKELREADKIRPGTMWKDVFPLIETNASYLKLLDNLGHKERMLDGSTPQDLFFDMLEDFDREAHDVRVQVEGILKVSRCIEMCRCIAIDPFIRTSTFVCCLPHLSTSSWTLSRAIVVPLNFTDTSWKKCTSGSTEVLLNVRKTWSAMPNVSSARPSTHSAPASSTWIQRLRLGTLGSRCARASSATKSSRP